MSTDFLEMLYEATLASSASILFVLMLRKPLRNYCGARVAYTFWCFVPIATMAVLLPAPEVLINIPIIKAEVAADTGMPMINATNLENDNWMPQLLFYVWGTGAVFFAGWFAQQQKTFIRDLGSLQQTAQGVFSAESNLQGPSVIGVYRPRIVLPSDFHERYNAEEQALVLSHEQAHLARGDTRINLMAAAMRCIFWFNPLLHWAVARFRFDQELSTDAKVLSEFPSSRKSYADAMLKTQMAIIGLPVACHWQAHHPLKERILMLKKSSPTKMVRVLGLSLVAMVSSVGAFAVWSAQPANVVVSSIQDEMLYQMTMDIDVDGSLQKDIAIREAPGKKFLIKHGEDKKQWTFEATLKPFGENRVFLEGELKYAGNLISEPAMELAIGKNSGMGISTKDGSSIFKLNFVVREWRNGNVVALPIADANSEGMGAGVLLQGKSGVQKFITPENIMAESEQPVSDDKIATPAKMMASAEFIKAQRASKNAGRTSFNILLLIGTKGEVLGADYDGTAPDWDARTSLKTVEILGRQKYQAAIGKQGEPVISNLPLVLYDSFSDIKSVK